MVEAVYRIPRATRRDIIYRDVVLVLQGLNQRLALRLVDALGPEHIDVNLVAADGYWHDALTVIRLLLLASSLSIHALHEIPLFTIILCNDLAYGSFRGDIEPLINVVQILTPSLIDFHGVHCRVLHVTHEPAALLLEFVLVVLLGLQGVELPPRVLFDNPGRVCGGRLDGDPHDCFEGGSWKF